MSSLFRIPRIVLPKDKIGEWISSPCKPKGQSISPAGQASRLVYFQGDRTEKSGTIKQEAYGFFENSVVYKQDFGCVWVHRSMGAGERRGVIACLDLEAFSFEEGERCPVRPIARPDGDRVESELAFRRSALLELPATVVLYCDKRHRLDKLLEEEELEELYAAELGGCGDVRGYFIPQDLAGEILPVLGEKLLVADGIEQIAAAKKMWEALKADLSKEEQKIHPARFFLAEMVNIFDEGLRVLPVRRIVKGNDEDFIRYFTERIKCRREGNLLVPLLPASSFDRIEEVIEDYLFTHVALSGRELLCEEDVRKRYAENGENGVCVMTQSFQTDELLAYWKGGKLLSENSVSVGDEREKRFYLEGREIAYD